MNHAIAKGIFKLLEDEAEARHGYEEFLAEYGVDKADIAQIMEIQADEANHMLILQAMVKKYDGGISATADGALTALQTIANGISD